MTWQEGLVRLLAAVVPAQVFLCVFALKTSQGRFQAKHFPFLPQLRPWQRWFAFAVVPVAEEAAMCLCVRPALGILLASVAFGCLHGVGDDYRPPLLARLQVVMTTYLGCIVGYVWQSNHSLATATLLHCTWNAIVLLSFFALILATRSREEEVLPGPMPEPPEWSGTVEEAIKKFGASLVGREVQAGGCYYTVAAVDPEELQVDFVEYAPPPLRSDQKINLLLQGSSTTATLPPAVISSP